MQSSTFSGRASQEQNSPGGQREGANAATCCLPDSVAAPQSWGVQAEVGKDWPGSVNASGFCSSDGQEVAVVYYREGYVPKNYDQQVSTDRSSCPRCGLASEFEMPCDPRGLCPVLSGVSPVQRG